LCAVETIERMDEDIELKENKIHVLEKELKDVNQYGFMDIRAQTKKRET
jgi:hypothetical protein